MVVVFPTPLDADDQHHRGTGGKVQRAVTHLEHFHQDFPERRPGLLGGFEPVLPYLGPESIHGLHGGVHPQVGQDQALLQLVVKVVVNLRKAGEDTGDGSRGLAEALLDFVEKAHVSWFLSLRLYSMARPVGRHLSFNL